jgi:hypothetical protein
MTEFVVGGIVAVLFWVTVISIFKLKKDKPKYFAACEFWVYLPHEKLPSQEAVMTAMVAQNPHARPGFTPIGSKEGILFSDIRLHVSHVLRSKNPHTFRPDLFEDGVVVSAGTLAALAESHSFVKVRYVSEVPLADSRHLTFMLHFADAYARLGGATAVYDVVSEVLYTPEEFHARIGEHADTTRPELHVRVEWNPVRGVAFTKGLIKVGLPELETAGASADMRQLVVEVMREAAHRYWEVGSAEGPMVVEYFGDRFEVTPKPKKGGGKEVHIVRIQARV